MTATILRGDARNLPLTDESVDLIVSSPPYWSLRAYTDGGEAYDGQIGAEPTPQEYIATLLECTREWARVLKPTGSMWINLGDSYAGQAPGRQGATGQRASRSSVNEPFAARRPRGDSAPAKSLRMLPERYRIGCVDELGLIARAVVVWSKPNGLPESVTDRVRRSHEDWVHLTRLPRYFSAVDEIREAHAPGTAARYAAGYKTPTRAVGELGLSDRGIFNGQPQQPNPLGKLPGSVWEIATEPLKVPAELGVDHFAAFPTEWPRRIVLGWSPSGICTACGEGRRPVMEREQVARRPIGHSQMHSAYDARADKGTRSNIGHVITEHRIAGEACACAGATAPTRPAVVLDPFGGTGTTALVASVLGRHGIGVDMSADYCRLARWRTQDPAQRAKAARVEKPPTQMQGQQDLFGEWVS